MKQHNSLKTEVESWRVFSRRLHDALELAQLDDESLRGELEVEISALEAELNKRSFNAMFSGKYDRDSAILAIHAGAGGTDSQDWAAMLQRMYLRWAEDRGFQTEILDSTSGEEAGIKSDLKIDVFRSSGAGGQNVQKNATAIRITHIPTGIVVTCQNERSQTQNREFAMRILRARLLELRQAEREEERAVLRGEYTKAEWGSQIRSYVLHPYQMVKDHRTDHESGNTQAVLDGELDEFMEAFLRKA